MTPPVTNIVPFGLAAPDVTFEAPARHGCKRWCIERQPRKKLEPSAERLLGLLHRWRDEAVKAGRKITRIALALEAGRDGFWLARWLRARGVEAHVIHPSSVAVSREHRRAKTDQLDTELLKRGLLGCLPISWKTPIRCETDINDSRLRRVVKT